MAPNPGLASVRALTVLMPVAALPMVKPRTECSTSCTTPSTRLRATVRLAITTLNTKLGWFMKPYCEISPAASLNTRGIAPSHNGSCSTSHRQ